MSFRSIHLRKLLKILYSGSNSQISEIRKNIREDIARESGRSGNGGDFYAQFWHDAKQHVFGLVDLHDATEQRIEANWRCGKLYPRLRDGFLVWWNERRRWTNEPFRQAQTIKSRFEFPDLQAVVKIDNIMAVRDARDEDHFIYPYFAPEPVLHEEAARLGLWLLSRALPVVSADELRILDVIRGQTFSIDRNPLNGDEEGIFRRRYEALLRRWDELRDEYE